MTQRFMQCGATAALILLTACGGGGGGGGGNDGGGGDPTPFADTNSKGSVAISAVALNSGDRATAVETGTYDDTTDTFGFADLSGSIDANGATVILDDGGRIEIIAGSTEHAARFVATPSVGDRTIGVVGFETPLTDLPSGSVSYTGTSELTIVDNSNVFALTGDTTITADFGTALVDTTVDNLDGTLTAGASAPTDVTDVASITFTGSSIADAQFTGGTAAITSTMLTELSGDESTTLNGAFYGPGADEAGAVFVIDDAAEGDITVFGTVLAD